MEEIIPNNLPETKPVEYYKESIDAIFAETGKVVVGQKTMINRLLIGLFCDGHVLLEGLPGLAKTLTVNTLAKVLDLNFQRIQFTPDLLPADLVGTMIYNQAKGDFEVKKGPVFANIILADEINRSPAKVQAALLECMQERQVTIGETTFKLDLPFLTLATQNPIEQEGTYPLPEAQVDRFMFKIDVGYPTKDDELEIMRRMANLSFVGSVNKIISKPEIFEIRSAINTVTVSEAIERYIIELVYATRQPANYGMADMAPYIKFGASPRASINLYRAARAAAFFEGRDYVLPEDVKEMAADVLGHRIMLNYEAEADQISARKIIETTLSRVAIKR